MTSLPDHAPETPAPPRPRPVTGSSRYVIFMLVSFAVLMGSIDGTIVATALPTMTRELHTTLTWSTWTLTIYSLGQIVALPIAGRLSDAVGRRRMFLVFVALFTVSSLLAGLVNNVYLLIALRFLQALGGGGLMPSTTGVVSDLFTKDRDRAIGLISSFFPLGALIGPTLGGFIVTNWSWRDVFFVNVPVGAVLLVLLFLLLPASKPATRPRIDVAGAILMGATIICLMLGISQLGQGGGGVLPWAEIALGVVLGIVFVYAQRRTPHAILPPALLQRREFLVVNCINIFYGAAAFGIFSLVPLFAQLRYGESPLVAGSLLSVRAVGMATLSVVSAMLLRRTGYRKPMIVGFVLLGLGLLLLPLPPIGGNAFLWLGMSSLVCGLGVGVAGPASNNAVIQLMPDQVAAISGLRAMFRQTGGILAITVTAAAIGSGGTEASSLGHAFLIFAAMALVITPLVLAVPERQSSGGGRGQRSHHARS
ncbi:MAG: MFS transporter [Candidatus Dormiibacterota bacterium]